MGLRLVGLGCDGWVELSGVELGKVVLGWVDLKLYQEGLCWFRLVCWQ